MRASNAGDAPKLAAKIDVTSKLDAVPDRDIDLFFSRIDRFSLFRPYVVQTLNKRDPKVYKPIVIAGLEEHPFNIVAIYYYGWYQDAKEPIRRVLQKSETMGSMMWFQAFVEVAEPKHYPKLKQLVLTDRLMLSQYLPWLELLPGFDIPEINPARLGDVDALGRLIQRLNEPKAGATTLYYYNMGEFDNQRRQVVELTGFKGTNKEMLEWFQANRDQLAFDNFTKRYVILEDF